MRVKRGRRGRRLEDLVEEIDDHSTVRGHLRLLDLVHGITHATAQQCLKAARQCLAEKQESGGEVVCVCDYVADEAHVHAVAVEELRETEAQSVAVLAQVVEHLAFEMSRQLRYCHLQEMSCSRNNLSIVFTTLWIMTNETTEGVGAEGMRIAA